MPDEKKKYHCTYHKDETKHLRKHRQTLCPWKGGGGHVCLFTTREPPEGEIGKAAKDEVVELLEVLQEIEAQ